MLHRRNQASYVDHKTIPELKLEYKLQPIVCQLSIRNLPVL